MFADISIGTRGGLVGAYCISLRAPGPPQAPGPPTGPWPPTGQTLVYVSCRRLSIRLSNTALVHSTTHLYTLQPPHPETDTTFYCVITFRHL